MKELINGQCLIDFEKWLEGKMYPCYHIENEDSTGIPFHYKIFFDFPESMQYGVLVDFFDYTEASTNKCSTVDIETIEYGFDKNQIIHLCRFLINGEEFKKEITRKEARREAIKKAVEIYNSK